MSVFALSISGPGGMGGRFLPVREAQRRSSPPARVLVTAEPAATPVARVAGMRYESPETGSGTLRGLKAHPEVKLERTREQIAEQAANGLLVRRCLAGEARAWQEMVAGQHKRVYGICFRFTGSAADAEDATQDVFLKVYRNLRSFDESKGSFPTWITTMTRNLLVDRFRRTRMERASDSLDAVLGSDEDGPTLAERLPDVRPGAERHVAGLQLKATIQAALAQVSPDLREAVILRDLEDMDYKEIAQVLGIPEGTVKSRISRGRAELGRLLKRSEGKVI